MKTQTLTEFTFAGETYTSSRPIPVLVEGERYTLRSPDLDTLYPGTTIEPITTPHGTWLAEVTQRRAGGGLRVSRVDGKPLPLWAMGYVRRDGRVYGHAR